MKYIIKELKPNMWRVEREDGTEYSVVYHIGKQTYMCDCKYNSLTGRRCKHIRAVIRYVMFQEKIFVE